MKFIVACDENGGIGNQGDLLFRLGDDMLHFKNITTNNVVVMGKNTYLSLPEQNRPLKNRVNIVLSSTLKESEGLVIARSIDDLFNKLKGYDTEKVFVIGGASIYQELCPYCSCGYVTHVKGQFKYDVSFSIPKTFEATEYTEDKVDSKTNMSYKIVKYENKQIKEYNFNANKHEKLEQER